MVVVRQLCKSPASARGLMSGGNAKKRRRRALAAKRKKYRPMSQSLVPMRLVRPEPRPSRMKARSLLAGLGLLTLLGAGALNRSDDVSVSVLDTPRAALVTTPVQNTAALSSNVGLIESRTLHNDGLLSNAMPRLVLPATELLPPTPLSILAKPAIGVATSVASPENTSVEQLASLDPVLTLRDWPLLEARPNALPSPSVTSSLLTRDSPQIGLHWERLALVQTGSIGMTMFGFQKFDEFFGRGQQEFRAGNDWSKDRTLHFDELIHFQGGYRITQGLIGMYRWAGLNPAWSESLGAGTAASVMTFLEYVDGRRPTKQGASYSDFTANLLGVGFALAKMHIGVLQDVDLRLNYTSFGDVLQKKTLLKYDRMTHWLTYDLQRQVNLPLHVGVGYGVQNAFKPQVHSEYYLGVGFTPVAILERYYPAAAKPFSWLNMYHIGWQVQVK